MFATVVDSKPDSDDENDMMASLAAGDGQWNLTSAEETVG